MLCVTVAAVIVKKDMLGEGRGEGLLKALATPAVGGASSVNIETEVTWSIHDCIDRFAA